METELEREKKICESIRDVCNNIEELVEDNDIDCNFPNLHHHYGVMDNDNHYNPKLKHSTEYQEMFNKLNVIQPTTNLTQINYPFHYEKVETPPDDFLVDGFFQSEKYFKHNRKLILDIFSPTLEITTKIEKKSIDFKKSSCGLK